MTTHRNAVTERYLGEMARRGLGGDELPAIARRNDGLLATSYRGKFLTRPAFLERAEVETLEHDLEQVRLALGQLPHDLFGGDMGAFARAAGLAEAQAAALEIGPVTPPTRIGRADLYHDGTGFRLMELNLGAALGGIDNAMLNPEFLRHPGFAAFARDNGLEWVDTLAESVDTLFDECDVPAGVRPQVAVVDWPASFVGLEDRLRESAKALAPLGIDAHPCHLGHLRFEGGRVWLDDIAVDVVYRLFLLEDVLEEDGPALMRPVLEAAARGEVRMFSPMSSDLYASKAALAMVSDEANRGLFSAERLASLDRLLPWTRRVRDGEVTVDGERVDLLSYASAHREQLVLKPTLLHGGQGVVLGWLTEQADWDAQLRAAADGEYVLQARITAPPEVFATADGGTELRLLNWGVFVARRGYAGAFARGATDLSGAALNSAYGGATLGCVFHQPPGGSPAVVAASAERPAAVPVAEPAAAVG